MDLVDGILIKRFPAKLLLSGHRSIHRLSSTSTSTSHHAPPTNGWIGWRRFQISKHCFGGKRGGTLNSKHCFGEVERLRSGTLKVESDAKTKREGTIIW